jgi:trans-L-3-hydroxyproline dehydratase
MDIHTNVSSLSAADPIHTVEMHTCGEPTRIIVEGFPELRGTLLEQRAEAKEKYDHLRKRLMWEPRGHREMYGAILIKDTEMVESGEADIGVLFMHNEGFSTMCGHGTIALGRLLVDTHDESLFPKRSSLSWDRDRAIASVNLHAPCGIVKIFVPTTPDGRNADKHRHVEFVSVPSFATAIDVHVPISSTERWLQLPGDCVKVSIAYGGAFYAIVTAQDLGFRDGLARLDLSELNRASSNLKRIIIDTPDLMSRVHHPIEPDLCFLYGVIVTDGTLGKCQDGTLGAETGVCFFAEQQVDRSPCGSGVCARVALSVAKGERNILQNWTYHSPLSVAYSSANAFRAKAVDRVSIPPKIQLEKGIEGEFRGVTVLVQGRAYYTGASTFVYEDGDDVSASGFVL